MKRRFLLISALGVAGVLAAGAGVARSTMSKAANSTSPGVPTTPVARGSLELSVHMDGELRASHQQQILAPSVGGALRILTLVDTGTEIKKESTVVEFDPADQEFALEQAESELLEAEQQIIKSKADTTVQTSGDKVKLLTARFDLRRAELDAQVKPELVAANDLKIRQASLDEARRTLAQTERDVASQAALNNAGLSVLEQRRLKAKLSADRARQNIESLVIKAPMDGVVSVRDNQDAAGGFFFGGMTLPVYRVGDSANPGRVILDIFDLSTLEIRATVNEQDRANLSTGQKVHVTSSVTPGQTLSATVKSIAGLGRSDRQAGPLRIFDVTLVLDKVNADLRPGTAVKLVSEGQKVDKVLVLPRQAVFEVDGKPVVYERTGAGFAPHPIKVIQRSESRVAVDGVPEGTDVALVNPDIATTSASGSKTPASAAGPGIGR
jgi:multidrug resistance efflux pump